MHVWCAHSRLLWPHYCHAVQEAARHLPPRGKAPWVASWRSAGAAWTEVLCPALVPDEAEAQLRAIARYDPLGGTSVDNFFRHMFRLENFAWELRNHRLEQLLRGRGQLPPPRPRPDKDFAASLRVVNITPAVPGSARGFSKHLQDALLPRWIIGRGSMTAWEARIVGKEWAREWGWWCPATRAPRTPVQRYAAIPLKGWGPHTRPRPTMIRGAGSDHLWDAAAKKWLHAASVP